jgi:hypothetical protein
MSRRYRDSSSDIAWRLRDIGGPDLAIRYLELAEESRRNAARAQPEPEPAAPPPPRRSVVVNGVRIDDEQLRELERAWGGAVADGNYWYDSVCGAWGLEGGPCAGFVQAGLELGGPLRRDASRGNTGVVINGRELHLLDVMALRRLGPVLPGRYWVDAHGNFGCEGGPALGNLAAAMQMAGGAGGRPWTVGSRFGSAGGDGSGFLFFNDGKTFWST